MGEFVETDQRHLGALPFEHGLFVLEMGEADAGAGREAPLQRGRERLAASAGVELETLVPETAGGAHLDGGAAEEDGGEVGLVSVA